jgi:hypothetical protein
MGALGKTGGSFFSFQGPSSPHLTTLRTVDLPAVTPPIQSASCWLDAIFPRQLMHAMLERGSLKTP